MSREGIMQCDTKVVYGLRERERESDLLFTWVM